MHFLNESKLQAKFKEIEDFTGFKFLSLKSGEKWVEADLKKIPIILRNGICKYL